MFLWWADNSRYSLTKFCFIYYIHQTFSFGFRSFQSIQNSLNGKFFDSPKDCKRHLGWLFAQKVKKKNVWNMKLLEKRQKIVEQDGEYIVSWSSWWKWKVCLLFLLKNWRNISANPVTTATVKVKVLSHVRLFATPWTRESVEFSRPEYRSGSPFSSPGNLPNPRIEPRSPALQKDSLLAEPPGKPKNTGVGSLALIQQIFLTQKFNQGLLHCRQILYQLSDQGSHTTQVHPTTTKVTVLNILSASLYAMDYS